MVKEERSRSRSRAPCLNSRGRGTPSSSVFGRSVASFLSLTAAASEPSPGYAIPSESEPPPPLPFPPSGSLVRRHRRPLALLPRASGRAGHLPVEVIDRVSRAVPRHHAPVRRSTLIRRLREDEQRRDLRGVRAQRHHLVRAPAHVHVSPHRREREVALPNRERDDLAVELRAHEREAELVAVVDLPRAPRGDGDEGLGAAALRRERDVLGDVPERAERVEQRGGGRRRSAAASSSRGAIRIGSILLSRRRAVFSSRTICTVSPRRATR